MRKTDNIITEEFYIDEGISLQAMSNVKIIKRTISTFTKYKMSKNKPKWTCSDGGYWISIYNKNDMETLENLYKIYKRGDKLKRILK